MKKILTLALTAALLLSAMTLLTIGVSAERDTATMKFGSENVELTLVEKFESFTATPSMGWGAVTPEDGKMKFESENVVDLYGIDSPMLKENHDFAGAKNFVFSVENRSDGDIFFVFQPAEPSGNNLFISGTMTDSAFLLVDENGKVETSRANTKLDVVSNRYGYIVPMGFKGYIVVPVALITAHMQWDTSYFSGDPVLAKAGFHVAVDDATYLEFFLDDMFICGELHAIEEPTEEPTEVPTEEPTETPTEEVTETPEETTVETIEETTAEATEEATQAATEESTTEAVTDDAATTEAATVEETEATEGGCGAVVGTLCILPLLAGAVLTLRKKD